jgi:Subtilase family
VSGAGLAARPLSTTEVIVTLDGPSLSSIGRSLTSARDRGYARVLAAWQDQEEKRIDAAIPAARVVARYRVVADGFALVLPTRDVGRLARLPGVAKIWPNLLYHSLAVTRAGVTRRRLLSQGPEAIGAEKLWGANLATAGQGMRIGIIDDGVDAPHPFFNPAGLTYPPGFPKGDTADATPKVIVQRTFAPPTPVYPNASLPFDPTPNGSFHATHVAGIAAGDYDTQDGSMLLSGVAPDAYLGNYKALTIPTPDFGLDGNSVSIASAIEAAVQDGMNVINLSLGEPEVAPSRDFVVHAIDAAARAGVVPVIAADNSFDEYGFGSISSPGNAPDAITVAATTLSHSIASFSSGGPTPVSLRLKPDVAAPGVAIVSSLPTDAGGPFGELSGTSMATPQVAGAAALLKQRHPTWTVQEIKSALVQTGDPVMAGGREASVLREGGGEIDLARADNPLVFADPTSISFPVDGGTAHLVLSDAGGGAGSWSVGVRLQGTRPGVTVSTVPTVSVPGRLVVTATVADSAAGGDVTGFVVLTRGSDTRRIPFWVEVSHPALAGERATRLTHPGTYSATTRGGESKISRYRYPTSEGTSLSSYPSVYPGPEVAYLVHLSKPVANFGVAVLSGTAVPHVVFAGDENHLAGFPGLPTDLNPYRSAFGTKRRIAGAVLPTAGTYEIVFDTVSAAAAGPFTFRFWVNDTTPPTVRVVSTASGTITVSIADAGSGVDPSSIKVTVDGQEVNAKYADGRVSIPASPGSHMLVVTSGDYQETKNMEDVAKIDPNTTTLRTTVTVG